MEVMERAVSRGRTEWRLRRPDGIVTGTSKMTAVSQIAMCPDVSELLAQKRANHQSPQHVYFSFRYNYPFLGVFGVLRQDEKGRDNERFR